MILKFFLNVAMAMYGMFHLETLTILVRIGPYLSYSENKA